MDKQDNKVTKNDLPQENNTSRVSNLPSIDIANSEAAEDKKIEQGKSVLDNKADFQSIFNVESEEKSDDKKQEIKTAAPVVEKKYEEPKPLPEDKDEPAEIKEEKKEKRKENFNGEERVIYEIKEEKEGNPIIVVLYFIALIVVIFALPYISKKVDIKNVLRPVEPTKNEEDDQNQLYYFNRSSVRAKIGNLEFTNFVKHKKNNNYTLTFNISNKQQKAYTFDEKYYIEFYENGQASYRALIYSNEAIGANAINSIELNISERSYNESDSFKIVEILPDSYPPINIPNVEGEYRVLTCTFHNDEINYYFLDNKLSKIREVYHQEAIETSKYEEEAEKYQKLSNDYKKIDKFNSTFISSAAEFTMINEFEYKDISDTVINNLHEYKFFRYNENKDIVNFEMEALNYNCG